MTASPRDIGSVPPISQAFERLSQAIQRMSHAMEQRIAQALEALQRITIPAITVSLQWQWQLLRISQSVASALEGYRANPAATLEGLARRGWYISYEMDMPMTSRLGKLLSDKTGNAVDELMF